MNASGNSDEFFEDSLYYFKKSIQILADDSNEQYARLSRYGILDEMLDELMSGEYLLMGNEFSNESRSILASIITKLRKICGDILEERVKFLEIERFETMEWKELRALSKKMLLSLDNPQS